jgi:peroxiredoxin Q/BCP
LKAWKKSESLPDDLLSDPDHAVLEAWGAWGKIPSSANFSPGRFVHWVIDENGILIDEQIKISPKDSVGAKRSKLSLPPRNSASGV